MRRDLFLLLVIIVTFFTSCSVNPSKNLEGNTVAIDLDSIRHRGKLIAITDFNSTDYFIYKGEPMGFNYELLNSFSDIIGIDLEIIPENNPGRACSMLKSGEADLLAYSHIADSSWKDDILLTEPLSKTKQVIVQHKPIGKSTPVSENQNISWGIRKENSAALLAELNKWITAYKKTGSYALLYAKYFNNSRSASIIKSDSYTLNSGKVSPYDDIIKQFSARINWDWRLLASLICQESHFNPDVESYAGAYGLMQIMPETGKNFGIDSSSSPRENIQAGIRYIRWLYSIFDPKVPDEKERINFILAAYNAGPGHVLDAMKLAEKNGMDPQKWNGNVAVWLLKKSQPRYYNDAVVKSGYFKGTESVNFVSEVLERFEHYKNIIPGDKMRPL